MSIVERRAAEVGLGCPPDDGAVAEALDALARLFERAGRVAVLTGAGCSTESGIPDYRGPLTRLKARNPVQHRAFVSDGPARSRYWARSMLGWPRFRGSQPNAGHRALSCLERAGWLSGLVTQNVDRLHMKAGTQSVVELHGALAAVRCLGCAAVSDRDALQVRLSAVNPGFEPHRYELAPDGDAELPDDVVATFRVPACEACGGVLKPDVVFFGDSVPRARVEAAFEAVDAAGALLVVGSSLAVFSGYRFVLRAVEGRKPVALVNLGESRADGHAAVRIDARAGDVLPRLCELLGVGPGAVG
jgi:NAD+-dependent protein deacetylase sirtuin 4